MHDAEKREKVISALEKRYDPERDNLHLVIIPNGLVQDALALLKEQEPKMVVKTTSTIRCPGCGKQITNKGAIHRDIKYCWKCGQAIMWESPKEEDND